LTKEINIDDLKNHIGDLIRDFSKRRRHCGAHLRRAHHFYQTISDARVMAFWKLELSINNMLMLLEFDEKLLDYEWAKENFIEEIDTSQIYKQNWSSFLAFERFAYLMHLSSALESTFRVFIKTLKSKGYKNRYEGRRVPVYRQLFGLISISEKTEEEYSRRLHNLFEYRNTIHNFGIFSPVSGDCVQIFNGQDTIAHKDGEKVGDLTFEKLNQMTQEAVDILYDVITNSEIGEIEEVITDPLAKWEAKTRGATNHG